MITILAGLTGTASAVTIAGGLVGLLLYGKASSNARALVQAHLDVVASWARGTEGAGWAPDDVTLDLQLSWLNPTQTIFPVASGPALIQLTLGDKLTLSPSTVKAIVALNQCIESFNAVLSKAEALRTQHAVWLARVGEESTKRVATLRAAGQEPNLETALGNTDDMRLAALVVINMLTMLHTGLIGVAGGNGLHAAWRDARTAFDEGRPI